MERTCLQTFYHDLYRYMDISKNALGEVIDEFNPTFTTTMNTALMKGKHGKVDQESAPVSYNNSFLGQTSPISSSKMLFKINVFS